MHPRERARSCGSRFGMEEGPQRLGCSETSAVRARASRRREWLAGSSRRQWNERLENSLASPASGSKIMTAPVCRQRANYAADWSAASTGLPGIPRRGSKTPSRSGGEGAAARVGCGALAEAVFARDRDRRRDKLGGRRQGSVKAGALAVGAASGSPKTPAGTTDRNPETLPS